MGKKEAVKDNSLDLDEELFEDLKETEPIILQEIDRGRKLFSDVPQEYRFWLSDGREIRNLNELLAALKTMKDDTFSYHVNREKNDFSNWVKDVLQDKKLADAMRNARKKEDTIAVLLNRKAAHEKAEKQQKATEMKSKMEIEQAIQKAKETESKLETAVFIEKSRAKTKLPSTELHNHPQPEVKSVEKILTELDKNPKTTAKRPVAQLKTLSNKLTTSQTMQKLYELRQRVGLKPLFANTPQKEAQKELPSPPQEKEIEYKKKEKSGMKPSKIMIQSPKIPAASAEAKSLREKEREMLEREKWINQEEERLNEKRLKLSTMRLELVKKRGELEKEKFESFMRKKAKVEEKLMIDLGSVDMSPIPKKTEFSEGETQGIAAAIAQARNTLEAGNLEAARQQLARIKSAISNAFLHPEEQRKIEYAMMELENDVKLAMI